MTQLTDRIVLFIDAPKASGCYLVEAADDEATKTRLDDDAQDAAEGLKAGGAEWTAHDVALALEGRGWAMAWLGLVEVAL